MLFSRRKEPAQTQNDPEMKPDAAAVLQLKKQMRRQIAIMAVCLSVATIAAVAFVTRAWFAMRREAAGTDSNITSSAPGASLYVRAASDATKQYASTVSYTATGSLFPSSTANLSDWYYASGFTYSPREVVTVDYTYTINTPIANTYTRISAFTSDAAGTYLNAYEGDTRVAYHRSQSNLYTTDSNLDVYLDSTNPIVVSYAENATPAKQLLNALRVGIKVGGVMKLIYAPATESGTGNSYNASANTYYYISDSTLTDASSVVKTAATLTPFLAQKQHDSDVLYEAVSNSPTPLGTATPSGVNVDVYVWLEGTDAQALYGLADSDTKGISVTVNYVGVEPS